MEYEADPDFAYAGTDLETDELPPEYSYYVILTSTLRYGS
jgi:hypothetical protein